jgi:hypothetical protein
MHNNRGAHEVLKIMQNILNIFWQNKQEWGSARDTIMGLTMVDVLNREMLRVMKVLCNKSVHIQFQGLHVADTFKSSSILLY